MTQVKIPISCDYLSPNCGMCGYVDKEDGFYCRLFHRELETICRECKCCKSLQRTIRRCSQCIEAEVERHSDE
jgi:hypothetical protein